MLPVTCWRMFEAGIAFRGAQVLPILSHYRGPGIDRRSIIDGMGVDRRSQHPTRNHSEENRVRRWMSRSNLACMKMGAREESLPKKQFGKAPASLIPETPPSCSYFEDSAECTRRPFGIARMSGERCTYRLALCSRIGPCAPRLRKPASDGSEPSGGGPIAGCGPVSAGRAGVIPGNGGAVLRNSICSPLMAPV